VIAPMSPVEGSPNAPRESVDRQRSTE
jgi:hypothetical protein